MDDDLIILGIGISPHKTDGVIRFEKFCQKLNLQYNIIGEGKIWKGGDIANKPGGGQKINQLLESIRDMENKLIIVTDTFDLFPVGTKEEILHKFHKICDPAKILCSAEVYCWPQKNLADKYPNGNGKYKYLNSGCLMGYRDIIFDMISKNQIMDTDDDQLFYTLNYLSTNNKIILDHDCQLFQALNGVESDIILHKNRIYNKYTNSYPVFIHGNGSAKFHLNKLENYIEPDNTKIHTIHPQNFMKQNFEFQPGNFEYHIVHDYKIFFALYVNSNEIFDMELFLNHVKNIECPNKIVYAYDQHFDNDIESTKKIIDFVYVPNTSEYVFNDFLLSDCDYYFFLEQQCIITKTDILNDLLDEKCRIISPLLKSNGRNEYFTNFWGSIGDTGYYTRSDDYIDIITYNKRGIWNVPYILGVILIERTIIVNWNLSEHNRFSEGNRDMALCLNFRKFVLFMYTMNKRIYGYLQEKN